MLSMTTAHAQRKAVAFVSMVVVDELLAEGLAYDTVAGFEPLKIHGDMWRHGVRLRQYTLAKKRWPNAPTRIAAFFCTELYLH
jgi:hypothetical protein